MDDDEDRFEELPDEEGPAVSIPGPSSTETWRSPPSSASSEADDEHFDFHDTHSEPLELQIANAETLKAQGNQDFGKKRWQAALNTYREGLAALPVLEKPKRTEQEKGKQRAVEDEEDEQNVEAQEPQEPASEPVVADSETTKKMKSLRSVLNANVGACLLQMKMWKETVEYCTSSLQDDPTYAKALHRRAQANEEIGSWGSLQSSLDDYTLLAKDPSLPASIRPSIHAALRRLPDKVKVQGEKEKAEMMEKLKEAGNKFLGLFGMSTDNFKMTQNADGGYSMGFQK